MYKVYSKNGNLIMLAHDNPPDEEGWTLEVTVSDPDYLKNEYQNTINWCTNRILELERQQDRPLREIAVAQSTGASSEFARNKVLQIDAEISSLRSQITQANTKLANL